MLDIASNNGFNLLELLYEGPCWPKNLLNLNKKSFGSNKNTFYEYDDKLNNMDLEIFKSYDIELMLHSPTIDLNPTSMNAGIRDETSKQIKEALNLPVKTEQLQLPLILA